MEEAPDLSATAEEDLEYLSADEGSYREEEIVSSCSFLF